MICVPDRVENVAWHQIVCLSNEGSIFLDMDDLDEVLARRKELIIRGVALVGVISVWMYARFRCLAHARPTVTYGPMSSRDEQRQKNLPFIYHSDDTHCINTLIG